MNVLHNQNMWNMAPWHDMVLECGPNDVALALPMRTAVQAPRCTWHPFEECFWNHQNKQQTAQLTETETPGPGHDGHGPTWSNAHLSHKRETSETAKPEPGLDFRRHRVTPWLTW